jgi:hypothetical protein
MILAGIAACALVFMMTGCASKPAPAAEPAAPATPAYPVSIAGNVYLDKTANSGLGVDFFDVDACDVTTGPETTISCPYVYDAKTGKGNIMDPLSPATPWFAFQMNASGSVMSFFQDASGTGAAIPMRKQ